MAREIDGTAEEQGSPQEAPYDLMPSQVSEAMIAKVEAELRRHQEVAEAAEQRVKDAEPAALARQHAEELREAPAPPPPTLTERLADEMTVTLKRSGSDWQVRTMTIGAGTTQLAGRRAYRRTLMLDTASASITIASSQEGLQGDESRTFSTTDSLSLDTEGPLYASGTVGTTVVVTEVYDSTGVLEEATHRLARLVSRQVEQTI